MAYTCTLHNLSHPTERTSVDELSFFDFEERVAQAPSGNNEVKVTVTPVVGLGPTQLGMFNIAVAPVQATDQLINVQFIVQYATESPQAFTAFIFLGSAPAGEGLSATPMFSGNDAIAQNRLGVPLLISVVGGVNSAVDPFFVTAKFPQNLWPPN